MTNQQPPLDRIFHALADPTRLAVISRLGAGEASVSELAEPFDMAMPSLLQHLKVLEDCQLIRSRKSGRVRTCTLEPREIDRACQWLAERKALWEARLDRMEDFVHQLQAKKGQDDP